MNTQVSQKHIKDAFRLARSGSYTTADQLRNAFAGQYPSMSRAQVDAVFRALATTKTSGNWA
jgi:hypothetical protein